MGTTTISFRHIDPDESLGRAQRKMARLQKYVEVPLDIPCSFLEENTDRESM